MGLQTLKTRLTRMAWTRSLVVALAFAAGVSACKHKQEDALTTAGSGSTQGAVTPDAVAAVPDAAAPDAAVASGGVYTLPTDARRGNLEFERGAYLRDTARQRFRSRGTWRDRRPTSTG